MMDTILNLGLNDETVITLSNLTDNERFAYDSYRRFIQMFGDVVMEIPKSEFDAIFDGQKEKSRSGIRRRFDSRRPEGCHRRIQGSCQRSSWAENSRRNRANS